MGSATAMMPASLPPAPRNITVSPRLRLASAAWARGATSMPAPCIIRALPSSALVPSIRPLTPCPVTAAKPATLSNFSSRLEAPRRMASARGCSLIASSAAARRSTSSSANPFAASTPVSAGLPSVRVPVLSITSVLTLASPSSAAALRTSTPACAPRPVATMIEIGVASPSAQGQAMISTLTAATRA